MGLATYAEPDLDWMPFSLDDGAQGTLPRLAPRPSVWLSLGAP